MADYRDTLLLPFEKGILSNPKKNQRWAVLNADVLPADDEFAIQDLQCEQGFRPSYLALQRAGYAVQPKLVGLEQLDVCLVLANRSRAVNERNMQRGWNGLKPGGLLVFAGDKTSGVQPLRKWTGQLAEIDGSLSKHHAVVFWTSKRGADWTDSVLRKPGLFEVEGLKVAPGMFSADGPDRGSQLLAQQFDKRLFGLVADFGAGWGYLSHRILLQCERVEQIELFEADWASLEAAKHNVEKPGVGRAFHWCDMTSEAPRGPFNWIVMNPPFHNGRAALPELGNAFIAAAARSLPAGGRLLMVANTNLPYENTLAELFKRVERVDQAHGFKVLEAVKGSR